MTQSRSNVLTSMLPSRSSSSSLSCIWTMKLLLVLLTYAAFFAEAASSSCPFCVNGKLASGSCECLCRGGYLGPYCSFKAGDDVTMDIVINRTINRFQSELFLSGLTGSCPGVNVTYLYATSVPVFASCIVRVLLPGYAVQRVLTSIAFNDPWVVQYNVIGAYPLTPLPQTQPWKFDYIIASTPTFVVSVSGVGWFVGALALAFVLAFLESCCMRYDEVGVEQMRIDERSKPRTILVSPKPTSLSSPAPPKASNPLTTDSRPPPPFERKPSVGPSASSGPPVRSGSFARGSVSGQQAIQVKPRSRVGM